MQIPSYKIHNVLKVFSEQLKQSKTSGRSKTPDKKLTIEGKRQAIIKKVTDEIFDKITQSGINEVVDNGLLDKLKENDLEHNKGEKNEFIFNIIDDKNKKITNRLLISNANVLIKQLEQIVKKAVNKKKDS